MTPEAGVRRRHLIDVAERVVWTFVQAAVSSLTVGTWLGIAAWKGALIAGGSAVLSLVKGLAASRLGSLPAATLPAPRE